MHRKQSIINGGILILKMMCAIVLRYSIQLQVNEKSNYYIHRKTVSDLSVYSVPIYARAPDTFTEL